MDFGPNVLAQVFSFTNELQEIPYLLRLNGKSMSCNCPSFQYRRACKHLSVFREKAKNGVLLVDRRFNVSDFGRDYILKNRG